MKYAYYPGCSLEGASRPYDRSLRFVMESLGHDLEELEDWNCCGATLYMSVKETVALSVSARNLALAEKNGSTLVAPCSACYTTLLKTQRCLRDIPRLRAQVDEALEEAGMSYGGTVRVRHPLDIIVNDIGVTTVVRKAYRRLDGLKIAPYYGCQIVRPEPGFDDPDWPTSMDDLFASLGAECVYFPCRVRCCGGMLVTTYPEVGDQLSDEILDVAAQGGADVVITTCPLCHMNLEARQVSRRGNKKASIPVLFFTQLLGLALGASPKEMEIHRSLIPAGERLTALAGARR
jgi:heterodisulfide reductase subunit B